MLRSRIIPCLLVHDGGLVKTQNFKDAKYVGDPINAVKIFNEKEADELMVLDIDASQYGKEPDFNLIEKLAAECRMPLCYGGGISNAQQASRIIDMGVEKVAVSSAAINNPQLLSEIAAAVGRQSVVAVLDVRKKKGFFSKGYEVCTHNATRTVKQDPLSLAVSLQDAGAGEIVFNFVDLDGTMNGYDIDYAELLKTSLSVPVTFLGGAGSLDHISQLIKRLGVIGAAAGSLFVFKGKYRAVLINYPTPEQKMQLCRDAANK
ncbi:imidazole glycerol phosphate synthase subunit HisF [Vibrio cholerae]|uniref:AglZ/HisF2 family acetamidino modification protein n=1 Tax=Vibrio cholerae TaxID=666 RepID=UPI001E32D2C8|nr:AglZ/HisF2 family acetamidino modification protein [Vibrio cholerae]ELE5867271.1 imidazole glycerol phosphate synthase subunit HisF [Vibrio cholerae]ELG7083338.1 imidazole glycerol phosphate synthase subunit HisF [Vibrio cholerae]MCD1222165.1 imidazole glycerol phosphate synthase subunit HisF [Vibrio cholerae]MCD1251692.1 imidazole glycerol phosphate synthase subunit HisF [Vibrio cholerae]